MENSPLISFTSALTPLSLSLMTTEDNFELLEKPAATAMQKGVPRNKIQSFTIQLF